jgi:hypothetical protein
VLKMSEILKNNHKNKLLIHTDLHVEQNQLEEVFFCEFPFGDAYLNSE